MGIACKGHARSILQSDECSQRDDTMSSLTIFRELFIQ
jgi:hypothetical protein